MGGSRSWLPEIYFLACLLSRRSRLTLFWASSTHLIHSLIHSPVWTYLNQSLRSSGSTYGEKPRSCKIQAGKKISNCASCESKAKKAFVFICENLSPWNRVRFLRQKTYLQRYSFTAVLQKQKSNLPSNCSRASPEACRFQTEQCNHLSCCQILAE